MKAGFAWCLLFALLWQPVTTAWAESDDLSPRPRGYSEQEPDDLKKADGNGPAELTVNYPEDAAFYVSLVKASMLRRHHKGSFKKDGMVWVLTDETSKKKQIIKLRHTSPRKQPDLKALMAVADLFPKNQFLNNQAARRAEDQKDWQAAITYYRRAFDPGSQSNNFERLLKPPRSSADKASVAQNIAYFELMAGRYASAIKTLTTAIELDPDAYGNYKNRSEAYLKLHKPELAEADQKKMKELASKPRPKPQIRLGDKSFLAAVLIQVGSYEDAVDTCDLALAKDPHSGLAHLGRARAFLRMGRYEDALVDYKELLRLTKDAPDLKAEVAIAETLNKRGPPPYGDLNVLKNPGAPAERVYSKSLSGKRQNMTASSIASYRKGGDYRVFSALCHAFLKLGMYKQLDAELDKMLTIVPDDPTVIGDKIQANEGLLNWPEAEKYCNRYLDLMANDKVRLPRLDFLEYVYTVRSLARRAQKNYTGAVDDETTVIKLMPDSAQAYRDRGDCCMQSGKYDQAAADYSKAIEFGDPKDGAGYLRRAMAYDKLKKSELANKDRDRASALQKSNDSDPKVESSRPD